MFVSLYHIITLSVCLFHTYTHRARTHTCTDTKTHTSLTLLFSPSPLYLSVFPYLLLFTFYISLSLLSRHLRFLTHCRLQSSLQLLSHSLSPPYFFLSSLSVSYSFSHPYVQSQSDIWRFFYMEFFFEHRRWRKFILLFKNIRKHKVSPWRPDRLFSAATLKSSLVSDEQICLKYEIYLCTLFHFLSIRM